MIMAMRGIQCLGMKNRTLNKFKKIQIKIFKNDGKLKYFMI
jgi:hypothetical protein